MHYTVVADGTAFIWDTIVSLLGRTFVVHFCHVFALVLESCFFIMICRYIRDLLLNPPSFDVASAIQGKNLFIVAGCNIIFFMMFSLFSSCTSLQLKFAVEDNVLFMELDSALLLKKRDRKSTRLNSSHSGESRMPSSA